MSEAPLIVLASGGTGGHVFPAEALAGALGRRGARLALVTDRRAGAYGGALATVETHCLSVSPLSGGIARRLTGVVNLGRSLFEARALLARLGPRAVIGFGGYPSLPTVLAAVRAGIATAIHEQNAVLGRANRWLAGRVDAIALSFREVAFLDPRLARRARLTGNPVRASVIALRTIPYAPPGPAEPLRLLVTGGSQGTTHFSKVVPAALAALAPATRQRMAVTQQCRPEDIEAVRAAYRAIGVEAELATFFSDLPARLARAHLLVARAGASSVAEILVAGRPAILVPYPSATDDHQSANARAVAQAGAGWVVPQPEFSGPCLAERLASLIADPASLARMAAAAHALGRPDAAERLADLAMELAAPNGARREEAA